MAIINNVNDFVYDFCRKYHFDKMPPEVRARYDTYAKNKDFSGNMKFWARDLDGKPLPTLDNSKLEKLYDLFQAVFENMAQKQKDFADNNAVKNFFNEWFGDGKVFNQPKAVAGVEARIEDFVTNVLDSAAYKNQLERIFKRFNLVPENFEYDSFVDKIKTKKYLTDPELRDTLFGIMSYAQDYSSGLYGPEYWPAGMGQYDISAPVAVGGVAAITDTDTKNWFKTQYNVSFRNAAPELLKQLVDSPKIFKAFQDYDYKKTISKNITKAIEATNYADEKSDDYVPPVYKDEKNVFQRIDDSLNKFKENQIDPWTNILRGTRRFFTPYAKTVVEACSKVKIKGKDGKTRPLKPTDGLKGILDNKDAITKKIQESSPTAKKHFDWFAKQMGVYATKMPNAFEGALRNPRKMRAIVSQLIYDAVQDGKVDEAKTAMEIISTMKYGIMHSRTVDALKQEDLTVLSHKDLSWNKYEGVQFVTKAMDKTAKFALLGIGRGIAAIHNKWMRDNTKLKGRGKPGSDLDKAHDNFLKRNKQDKHDAERHSRVALDMFAAGRGKSGHIITDATLAAEKAILAGLTPGTPDHTNLLNDIQRYEYAVNEKNKVATLPDGTNQWDKDHPDKYMELMAYWDMLESYWKSHQLTFAADKMRKNFLNGKARTVTSTYLSNYTKRYAA